MKTEKFPVGKLIFKEGDSGEEAYQVLSGSVEIFIEEDGQKLVLATLGKGEIFGEMAMVENRPRSASARAIEETSVEVICRHDFEKVLAGGGRQVVPYLTTIFERLRVTNDRLLAALNQLNELEPSKKTRRRSAYSFEEPDMVVQVEPDSEELRRQTSLQSRVVRHFPFQFGRRGELAGTESLIKNQLLVADRAPYRVSRQHCVLEVGVDGVFVVDRSSKLGTLVNGIHIGGASRESRVRLTLGENTLVLGGVDSQVRFKLTVSDI